MSDLIISDPEVLELLQQMANSAYGGPQLSQQQQITHSTNQDIHSNNKQLTAQSKIFTMQIKKFTAQTKMFTAITNNSQHKLRYSQQ